ncbi:hypothetical protein FBQ97_09675 [Acidobacteria bacterium ACD]|nr:MAG: hypothetical protein EDX89_01425 [Acidobacteriota bacterium]MDL1950065.1 hypothetical protein [Acidobacteria bacterium ACD]
MRDSSRFLLLVVSLWASPSPAHPPVAVVRDGRGNVFYSDLKRVFRVAPDGTKSVAVEGVHTHELLLDAAGTLHGEHLWYEGDATGKWGHRLWRRSPDGTVTFDPPREGFRTEVSFVRDARGNQYRADRGAATRLVKRKPDGTESVLSEGPFRDVRWMAVSPEGTLYLVDDGDLLRVTAEGKTGAIARNLAERRLRPPWLFRHDVMGLWLGGDGDVYVAVPARRVVKRVLADGRVSVAVRSRWPWSPTGGLAERDGTLWVLECGPANGVRLRRVRPGGSATVY